MQKKVRVTNISKENGFVRVRILAEEKLHPMAQNTAPTLEDYYLTVFGEEPVSEKA